MIDELARRISEKTGISEEQARSAAEIAINFVKEKLPAPIAGQVDGYLSGSGGEGAGGDMLGQAQNALGNIGGMFGGGDKSE